MRRLLARFVASAVGFVCLSGCSIALPTLGSATSGAFRASSTAGELQLFVMPDAGASPVLNAINSAGKSIALEMYILTDSGTTQQIVEALIAKAHAGVDVRVILEAQPYIPTAPGQQPVNINKAAFDALTAGGVRVQRSSPKFAYTHEKGMVIDGQVAYIMTMNMSNSAFSANREYVLADRDPVDVTDVARVFDADWTEGDISLKSPDLVVSPINSRAQVLKVIDAAKKSLVAQCEYCNDPEVVQHLQAAVQRHVDVKVMLSYQTPDPKTGEDTNAVEQKQLADAGITQLEFTRAIVMHAKSLIADGTLAYVGSENFTTNSLDRNREMGLLVHDPGVLSQLAQVAAKDWAAK